MHDITPPTPLPAPADPDPLSDSKALMDMALIMADLDTHDSMGLTDSAIGMILACEDETDSSVKAAQLEAEMVKSLGQMHAELDKVHEAPPKADGN